jgi:hypothetical protein
MALQKFKSSYAEGIATFGTRLTRSTFATLSASTVQQLTIPDNADHAIITIQPGAMAIYSTSTIASPQTASGSALASDRETGATTGTREVWGLTGNETLYVYTQADAWINVEWFKNG